MKEKEGKKVSNVLVFVQKVVDYLIDHLFIGELSHIQVAPRLEKKICFLFEEGILYFGNGIFSLCESDVILSIIHEMVHAQNFKKGIVDVGRNNYHNKSFLEASLSKGVFVIKHKNCGWSLFSLECPRNVTQLHNVYEPTHSSLIATKEVVLSIVSNFNWSDFYSFRFSKKQKTYKYFCSCPPPYNSIRSGRGAKSLNPLRIKCMYCEQMFTCEDR